MLDLLQSRKRRVDTRWYDSYAKDPKNEFVEKYWLSELFDEACPTWEYLVDGMIEVKNQSELEVLRQNCAHLTLAPNDKTGEVG
jgi:hypothetical protein